MAAAAIAGAIGSGVNGLFGLIGQSVQSGVNAKVAANELAFRRETFNKTFPQQQQQIEKTFQLAQEEQLNKLTISRESNAVTREQQHNQLLGLRENIMAQKEMQTGQLAFQRGQQSEQLAFQREMQAQQLAFQEQMVGKSVQSLRQAGLPDYLAFVNPSPTMMENVRVRGVNFRQRYKGGQSFL